jgi:hypothetical protein
MTRVADQTIPFKWGMYGFQTGKCLDVFVTGGAERGTVRFNKLFEIRLMGIVAAHAFPVGNGLVARFFPCHIKVVALLAKGNNRIHDQQPRLGGTVGGMAAHAFSSLRRRMDIPFIVFYLMAGIAQLWDLFLQPETLFFTWMWFPRKVMASAAI